MMRKHILITIIAFATATPAHAELKRYAIIDASGNVVNAIEYAKPPTNPPPAFPQGFTAVQADKAGPGWQYKNGIFSDPRPAPVNSSVDIIQSVTAMQIKVALRRAGRLDDLQKWIETQDAETQLIFSTMSHWRRNSKAVAVAATALGITSDQLDKLFAAAAAINP